MGPEPRLKADSRTMPPSVELEVTDSGRGLAPEILPHIFDPFRQGDREQIRRSGGLGLGLAIVKHLVELHGGSVTADSGGREGGATFRVRLPSTEQGAASDDASFLQSGSGSAGVVVGL